MGYVQKFDREIYDKDNEIWESLKMKFDECWKKQLSFEGITWDGVIDSILEKEIAKDVENMDSCKVLKLFI